MTVSQRLSFFLGIALATLPLCVYAQLGEYKPQSAGAGPPEIHINADGTIQVKSARVDQIAGTTFYVGVKWGQFPMRFTMKTDSKTSVTKRYGGTASIASLSIGDYIDVNGEFFFGSDFFGITARSVKDYSLTEEAESYSGTIVELGDRSLVLKTPLKNITVIAGSGLVIKKGTIEIPWGRLRTGDTVPLVDGVYDYAKNTLTAATMVVYYANTELRPRNYEGSLKSIDGTSLPTNLVVTVGGVDYTVYLSPSTPVFAKNKKPTVLGRFVTGDTIRFYGSLKESDKLLADQYVVSAEVVRNLSL
jgi:hypothetical protein